MDATLDYYATFPKYMLFILIITPILLYKGIGYNDVFIIFVAILLFLWDFFWILYTRPSMYIPDSL